MLATLMTSLIGVSPHADQQNQTGQADNPAVSNPWPVDDLASSRIIPSLTPPQSQASLRAQVNKAYGKLPLSFELNQGQTRREVKFLSRGPGYQLFLTQTEAVLKLRNADFGLRNEKDSLNPQSAIRIPQSAVLRVRLVVPIPAASGGLDELPGKSNYMKGNDRSAWQRNVPTMRRSGIAGLRGRGHGLLRQPASA